MNTVYVIIILYLSFAVYMLCDPPCEATEVCIVKSCKSVNDGIGICQQLDDCAVSDPLRATCIGRKCLCKEPYYWSTLHYSCKPNAC